MMFNLFVVHATVQKEYRFKKVYISLISLEIIGEVKFLNIALFRTNKKKSR